MHFFFVNQKNQTKLKDSVSKEVDHEFYYLHFSNET